MKSKQVTMLCCWGSEKGFDCPVTRGSFNSCYDALKMLMSCFDDEGSLVERYQDQLSVALEKADNAIRYADKEQKKCRIG